MRKRNLRLLDVGVPALLPLEAVIALVPMSREDSHCLLHWNVPGTCEYVMTVFFAFSGHGHRVFQMRVARVLAELVERVGRLLTFHTRMVCIPEKRYVVRLCAFQNRDEVLCPPKLAMRLNDHDHACWFGVLA